MAERVRNGLGFGLVILILFVVLGLAVGLLFGIIRLCGFIVEKMRNRNAIKSQQVLQKCPNCENHMFGNLEACPHCGDMKRTLFNKRRYIKFMEYKEHTAHNYNRFGYCVICGKACIHEWDGCKCKICGKARDEQHEWDECICKRCGQTRDGQHDWDGCRCRRCGKTRDEQHDWVNEIDEANSSYPAYTGDLNYVTAYIHRCSKCGKIEGE